MENRFIVFAFIFFMLQIASAQLPALIPYNDHGKWGYADSNGVIKIKPQFGAVSFFYPNGLAWVEKNIVHRGFRHLKYYKLENIERAIIDTNGKIIIPFQWLNAEEDVEPDKGFFLLQFEESEYSYWNLKGKYICTNCTRNDSFYLINRVVFHKMGRFGLKTLAGKVIVNAKYNWVNLEVRDYFNGFYQYCVRNDTTEEYGRSLNPNFPLWFARSRKYEYLLDSNGHILFQHKKNGVEWFGSCGIMPMQAFPIPGYYEKYLLALPDSNQICFVGHQKNYSCNSIYRLKINNDDINYVDRNIFFKGEIYLQDKYGRKYKAD